MSSLERFFARSSVSLKVELRDAKHRASSMRACIYVYTCTEMARDTPGSPMSRPRDLVGGVGATTTLTSGGYHAGSGDPASLHGHVLQQKILEVT